MFIYQKQQATISQYTQLGPTLHTDYTDNVDVPVHSAAHTTVSTPLRHRTRPSSVVG